MRSTQWRIFHRSAFLALWLVGVASCGSSTRDVGDTSTTAPIVITLDEPHDLSTVRTSKLVVRGTISGVTGGEVLVNETPLEIVDGRFDGTVTLREGKDVTLTVLHAPSGTRLVRTLYVDYTPPKLAINAPERATRRTPRSRSTRRCTSRRSRRSS